MSKRCDSDADPDQCSLDTGWRTRTPTAMQGITLHILHSLRMLAYISAPTLLPKP